MALADYLSERAARVRTELAAKTAREAELTDACRRLRATIRRCLLLGWASVGCSLAGVLTAWTLPSGWGLFGFLFFAPAMYLTWRIWKGLPR